MSPDDKRLFPILFLILVAPLLLLVGNTGAVPGQTYYGDGAAFIIPGTPAPEFTPWTWDSFTYTNDFRCLSCHGDFSGFFGAPDMRSYLYTGHKNMLRKVQSPAVAHGGPDGKPYAADQSGNLFDWLTNTISVGGLSRPLYYIFNGWMGAEIGSDPSSAVAPRAVYDNVSYTCARCHSTGFTMDTSKNVNRAPYRTFPAYDGSTDPDGGGPATHGTWVVTQPGGLLEQPLEGVQCERCHNAGTHFPDPGSMVPRGAAATALCLNCHRQEHTVGYAAPYNTGPGSNILPSAYTDNAGLARTDVVPKFALPVVEAGGHGGYAEEFYGHSTGMEFLNSPHARFSGNFNDIGTADNTDGYGSFFRSGYGGCTACHDVHISTVEASRETWKNDFFGTCTVFGKTTRQACEAAAGTWTPMRVEKYGVCSDPALHTKEECVAPATWSKGAVVRCTNCHRGQYAKTLGFHGRIPGDYAPRECEVCHMPKTLRGEGLKMHIWRINTDMNYRTFPTATEFFGGACSDTSKLSESSCLSAGGTWTPFSGVCESPIYGTQALCTEAGYNWIAGPSCSDGVSATSAACTANGFAWGALTYAFAAKETHTDPVTFQTVEFKKAVWVDIDLACGQCHGGGSDPILNPPRRGVGYIAKAILAGVARGYHEKTFGDRSGTTAKFSFLPDPAVSRKINFFGQYSICASGPCTLTWEFGGTGVRSTDPGRDPDGEPSYTYDEGGLKQVTLTVTDNSGDSDSVTIPVTVSDRDDPPSIGTITPDITAAPIVTLTFGGISADASKIFIDWRDGTTSTLSSPFGIATHDYSLGGVTSAGGTYYIMVTVIDSKTFPTPGPDGVLYTFDDGSITKDNQRETYTVTVVVP